MSMRHLASLALLVSLCSLVACQKATSENEGAAPGELIAKAGPAAPGAPAAAWWPQWRGPNRDGKSTETGLLKQWPAEGPAQLWHATGLGEGFSSVAVTADGIYVIGKVAEDLILFCFNLDGSAKWKVRVAAAYVTRPGAARATPVTDGDRVYVEGGGGYVGCFAAADGKLIWSADLKAFGGRPGSWGFSESPLIYENLCIVTPGGKNAFVALDKLTGAEVWRSSDFTAAAHYSSPIAVTFGGVPMIVNGTGAGIFAVSPKDGSLLWSNGWCAGNTANCPTPAYSEPYIFWANGYGKGGICLKLVKDGDSVKAEQVWTSTEIDNHHGGYILDQGYIYGHHKNTWVCMKLETGEVVWKDRGVGKGSVTYADGKLYTFAERAGEIALVDATPKGYQEHGRFKVAGTDMSWAHPVVAAGRLYLRFGDNLYCFDIKAK